MLVSPLTDIFLNTHTHAHTDSDHISRDITVGNTTFGNLRHYTHTIKTHTIYSNRFSAQIYTQWTSLPLTKQEGERPRELCKKHSIVYFKPTLVRAVKAAVRCGALWQTDGQDGSERARGRGYLEGQRVGRRAQVRVGQGRAVSGESCGAIEDALQRLDLQGGTDGTQPNQVTTTTLHHCTTQQDDEAIWTKQRKRSETESAKEAHHRASEKSVRGLPAERTGEKC